MVWVGETSTVDQSRQAERAAIESYLASGELALSGSELAWHLGRSFDDDELSFFEETLGASYVADAASSYDLAVALTGRAWWKCPTMEAEITSGLDILMSFRARRAIGR